jgi:hypothetical protein
MKPNFEKLRVYRRQLRTEDQVRTLKPLLEELPPRLNAYLKSIGLVERRDSSAPAGGDPDRT